MNKINRYAEGICLERKDADRNIGTINQLIFSFFLKAKNKYIKEDREKIAAWWSINGVPTDG